MKTGQKNTAGVRGLVPTPAADRPLTKAQKSFRDLLAKVESLRETIETEEQTLDSTLSFFAAEIVPRMARQTALRKELVRALMPYVNKTFFPRKPERIEIRELIQEFLGEIAKAEKGLHDDGLREIYAAMHGVGYAEFEQKTHAAVKEALAKMYAEAGLVADFSELDSAVSEAEFMAKAEELTARVRKMKEAEEEEARCHETGHHSADDEQRRIAEELRKRSIATIYKQLARVLHPDLERDTELQKQKVELMQELTVAFRQNDLHTLLRLELQWIENESSHVDRLTEEKLGVYNEVLGGQVEALEARLQNLVFHERYRPILVWENRLAQTVNGPEKALELDESVAALEQSVRLLGAATKADDVRFAIGAFLPAPQHPHD